jgi:hypothetical protein
VAVVDLCIAVVVTFDGGVERDLLDAAFVVSARVVGDEELGALGFELREQLAQVCRGCAVVVVHPGVDAHGVLLVGAGKAASRDV